MELGTNLLQCYRNVEIKLNIEKSPVFLKILFSQIFKSIIMCGYKLQNHKSCKHFEWKSDDCFVFDEIFAYCLICKIPISIMHDIRN